jgi:hypothetical protein
MVKPTTFKHIGSGLNPSLCVKLFVLNGFNHLSLQHNLPHRHGIVLRINQMHEIQAFASPRA